MRVIDASGQIRATPLIESIQVRRYLVVPERPQFDSYEAQLNAQQSFEFIASRISAGSLREVRSGDRDFYQFLAHDTDPFELSAEALARFQTPDPFRNRMQRDVLRSCTTCHAGPGIHSVQSIAQITNDRQLLAPTLVEADPEQIMTGVMESNSYQLGLLRGLWEGLDRR